MQCLFTYHIANEIAFTDDQCPWISAPSERERLDDLLGLALLDPGVRERLLVQRDPSLLEAFNLSNDTQQSLANARVSTLQEFAQTIVAAAIPNYMCARATA